MVQIRENWTDISGRVQAVRASAKRPSEVEVEVRVDAAQPVEGFADFLSDRVGSTIVVRFRAGGLQGPEPVPGSRVTVRVRRGRGADEVYAHGTMHEFPRP